MTAPTVLHLSPHPDDEALGAPATLLGLRDGGWHVVNALASLGHEEDRERRTAEAQEAARRSGFELVLPETLVPISSDADPGSSGAALAGVVGNLIERYDPALVVAPATTDAHHGHRIVGLGVELALLAAGRQITWWAWSVWSELPDPTLYVPFDDRRLDEALYVLAAYAGELDRNPYDRLVRGRSEANVVLGSERLFGFGASVASPLPFAELLTELTPKGGRFIRGAARLVDLDEPLGSHVPGSRRSSAPGQR